MLHRGVHGHMIVWWVCYQTLIGPIKVALHGKINKLSLFGIIFLIILIFLTDDIFPCVTIITGMGTKVVQSPIKSKTRPRQSRLSHPKCTTLISITHRHIVSDVCMDADGSDAELYNGSESWNKYNYCLEHRLEM